MQLKKSFYIYVKLKKTKKMKAKKVIILSAIAIAAMVMCNCKGGSDANAMIAKKWKWESFESKAFDEQMTAIKTQADTTQDSTTKVMLQQNLAMMSGIMEAMKSTT